MNIYTDSQQYQYDAFISYSHLDKKAAASFQRWIEHYRIPKEIRMTRDKDSVRLKIFRDETDLPAGSLTAAVEKALDSSKKLIVICSSTATEGEEKYKWVEMEVQHFIDTGRCSDILPILLDGDWEAMPANLRMLKQEQFITDVSQLKQRTAFLKILAGVLDTDYDSLVKRDKTRRRVRLGSLAVFCGIFLALCFYYFWPHTVYYADYTMRFGKPEGINPLTPTQRASRSESYAITTTHSKHEIRLEHVNSAGLVSMDASQNHLEQIATAIYNYLNNGQINTVTFLDETGKQLYTHSYAPDLSYLDIIKSKDDARWLTLPTENGENELPVRTNISRYQLTFYKDGSLSRRIYAVDRLPTVNENGIGGESYQYDSQGRLKKITYLDTTGNSDINKYGIAGENFLYDHAGHISRREYFGADGKLICCSMKYAAAAYEYDSADENLYKISYFNEKNDLVITAHGYAQVIRNYDRRGFLTSCAYFDDNTQPVRGPYRFHKTEIVSDNMGRDITSVYLDTNNFPILTLGHYAKCTRQYNEQGLVEDIFYYGENGQLNLSAEGSCRVHYKYDMNGNTEEISHYGLDGCLIFSNNGYAVMKLDYNEDGLLETERYFGVDNEPIPGPEGYHEKKFVYDNRYNIHEIHLTGTMGQPALCNDGYALRILEYDNAGNIESDAYFDDYDQPTYREGFYSKTIMKYDERGHRISTQRFNPDETPANQAAYSSQEVEYDDLGREEKIFYYLLEDPIFVQEYTYQGNSLSMRTDYLNGSEDGSRTVHRYDRKGNEVETINYIGDNLSGRSASVFDTFGNMVQRTFYNAQDEKTHYFISEYNSYGLPVKTSYYNADGKLSREANTTEHVAVVVSEYDEHNLKIERKCYDEHETPLRIVSDGKEAYARLTMTYDRNGNCTKSTYYDEKGDVYQSIIQEYDTYNRELNRIYLDGYENQLVRKEVSYDSLGNAVSRALYDRRNEPQADPASGVAKILLTCDNYGYVIGEEFYGEDGLPTEPYGTYHKYHITRENGRSVEIRYYGTDGQLTLNQDGYAIEKFTYDKRGNETSRAFFGTDEEPILLKWRFSRYEVQYDDKGNLIKSRFFDTIDREVQQVDGYLDIRFAYINNIPKRLLIFNGNDGASLMGDIELKLYIPLQEFVKPDDDNSYTEDALQDNEKEHQAVTVKDNVSSMDTETEEAENISFSEREYITTVNDYVRAIEHFDGTRLMDVIELSMLNVAARIAASQLGVDISEYKIYHFYASFYSEELTALQTSLHEKYSSDIYITYEILAENYWPADEIAAMNDTFQDLGIDDLLIQQMVTLDITYTVSGSSGRGSENEGFLDRQLVLMQTNGQWKIAAGEHFPSPPENRLIKLYSGK